MTPFNTEKPEGIQYDELCITKSNRPTDYVVAWNQRISRFL